MKTNLVRRLLFSVVIIFLAHTALASPVIINYTYDDLNRLTTAAYVGGQAENFSYDEIGNRMNYSVTGTGLVDSTGPSLTLANYTNNQHLVNPNIILTGTASDLGNGDNGVLWVGVNGNRAGNGTTTGSGTANWNKSITLHPGANTITIFASDNSTNQNQRTQTITLYYDYPPTVTITPATGTTGISATLNGSANPNGLFTTYYFQYGLTTSYGSTTGSQSLGNGSSNVGVSASITGLLPATTYHYRLVADNSMGTGHGSDGTFTTLAIPPTVSTGSATNVSANAATLNGTMNPNGLSTTYYFQWGLTASYGSTTAQSTGTGWSNIFPSTNLAGLTPNTTYHYRLVATNNSGTSYGTDGTFTTLAIPPTVSTGPATNVTSFIATLNGTVNPNGASTTYYFQWGLTTSYGNTTTQAAGSGWSNITTSAGLIGLTLNATYHYRQVANNFMGTTYGADMTFTAHPTHFDFDGDGEADILWRHAASGEVAIWLMDGTTHVGGGSLGVVNPGWKNESVGDFNGDGYADILWRYSASGEVAIWLMNGLFCVGGGSLGIVDLGWKIENVGDFNGDGEADILWRHVSSGQVYIWLLNGTVIIGQGLPGTVSDINWEIIGVADFNGDRNADILWRYTPSGMVYIWLMNGTTYVLGGSPGTVGDGNWKIVAPK